MKEIITILKYQELHNALKISEGDPIRTAYNILSVLTGNSVSHYRMMKWSEFQKVQKDAVLPDINIPTEYIKDFEVYNPETDSNEKFIVVQHATDWTTEQFVNMSTLTKDTDGITNNLHLILATLCVKKLGEDVDKTEFNRRAKLFQENLPCTIGFSVGFFFAELLSRLSATTEFSSLLKTDQNLSKNQTKLKKLMKMIGLQKNGAGITS